MSKISSQISKEEKEPYLRDLLLSFRHFNQFPSYLNVFCNLAAKILVLLTMPVERTSEDIPLQIEYLWGLKASITSSHIVPVILSLLEGPLENLEWWVGSLQHFLLG